MKSITFIRICLIIVLIVPHLTVSASDKMYRYVDQNGQVGFTDDISLVPVDQRTTSKTFRSIDTTQTETLAEPKDELLYYDKATDTRIINREGFLLKITKNEKGLKVVSELGSFPDAYPKNLPEPGTHINMPLD